MTFKDLKIIDPILKALDKKGYVDPTPIQEQSLPSSLQGKDIMGIAQTGTGKTAAFVIPILQALHKKRNVPFPKAPHALVLTPTRELAAQVGKSFATYGKFLQLKHTTIFGGVHQGNQVKALNKGVDILIATPGRLLDLIEQRHLKLKDVSYFVLDEADRMLDMGFIKDIQKVIKLLPSQRQTSFFSATMSRDINALAKKILTDPVHIESTPESTTVELIDQKLFYVDDKSKNALLLSLIKEHRMHSTLVFVRTKVRANRIAELLQKNNIKVDAIHGNKSQNQRIKALNNFKNKNVDVLVATDIAARGIDVKNISHVINYDIPFEPENYVHRIGRTARAGASGDAYSFASASENKLMHDIEKTIKMEIPVANHRFHSEAAQKGIGATKKGFQKGRNSSKKRNPHHTRHKKKKGKKRFSRRK